MFNNEMRLSNKILAIDKLTSFLNINFNIKYFKIRFFLKYK